MRVSWPLFVIPFVGGGCENAGAEGLLVLSLGRPVEDAAVLLLRWPGGIKAK
jgi:hypothetical protein